MFFNWKSITFTHASLDVVFDWKWKWNERKMGNEILIFLPKKILGILPKFSLGWKLGQQVFEFVSNEPSNYLLLLWGIFAKKKGMDGCWFPHCCCWCCCCFYDVTVSNFVRCLWEAMTLKFSGNFKKYHCWFHNFAEHSKIPFLEFSEKSVTSFAEKRSWHTWKE